MIKSELIAKLAEENPHLTQRDIERVVSVILERMIQALEEATWCSADPLCGENRAQGFGSLNYAACHACTLISETSCEATNSLLDRALVIGSREVTGFFQDVVAATVGLAVQAARVLP